MVVVIVLQALYKLCIRTLNSTLHRIIAGLSFVAIFALSLPFPAVIVFAAIVGFASHRSKSDHQLKSPKLKKAAKTAAIWLLIWVSRLPLLWVTRQDLLLEIAGFFSLLAVVTFGGAYAVLAYMTQEVVLNFGWLDTRQMIDALGLAETTPGPLILVTQFVGILAGHGHAGWPMAALAGALTLWMTFVPCFLWIFAGAPYIERLSALPRLSAALQAITAAVVGVILSLSLWFGLHVLFAQVTPTRFGPVPEWASLDLNAAA